MMKKCFLIAAVAALFMSADVSAQPAASYEATHELYPVQDAYFDEMYSIDAPTSITKPVLPAGVEEDISVVIDALKWCFRATYFQRADTGSADANMSLVFQRFFTVYTLQDLQNYVEDFQKTYTEEDAARTHPVYRICELIAAAGMAECWHEGQFYYGTTPGVCCDAEKVKKCKQQWISFLSQCSNFANNL